MALKFGDFSLTFFLDDKYVYEEFDDAMTKVCSHGAFILLSLRVFCLFFQLFSVYLLFY